MAGHNKTKALVPRDDRPTLPDRFHVHLTEDEGTAFEALENAQRRYERAPNSSSHRSATGVTLEEALAAIPGTMGVCRIIADRLGLSRRRFYELRKQWPELEEARLLAREFVVDVAETNIYRAIMEGNLRESEYALDRIGAERGWSPKKILEGNPDKPIEHKHSWEGSFGMVLNKMLEAGLTLDDVLEGHFVEVKELASGAPADASPA